MQDHKSPGVEDRDRRPAGSPTSGVAAPVPTAPPSPDPLKRPYRPRPSRKKRTPAQVEAMRLNSDRHTAARRPDRIAVPGTLVDSHPLVEGTLASLRKAVPEPGGMVTPTARRHLQVSVTPGLVDRAMRVLDTLLKEVERRGWRVRVDPGAEGGENPRNVVWVGAERFELYLHELVDSVPHRETEVERRMPEIDRLFYTRPQRDYVPSGRLHFGIVPCHHGRGHWSDTTR